MSYILTVQSYSADSVECTIMLLMNIKQCVLFSRSLHCALYTLTYCKLQLLVVLSILLYAAKMQMTKTDDDRRLSTGF